MIYFIIAGLLVLFGVFCVTRQIKEDSCNPGNDGAWIGVGVICILATAIICIGTMAGFIGWQKRAKKYEFLDAFVSNKLTKIEMMKQSYRELAYEPEMNIDLVNKDLTASIAKEIRELEEFVYNYNARLAEWTVKYKYRFWNTCFVRPPLDEPIQMSKWIQPASKREIKGK